MRQPTIRECLGVREVGKDFIEALKAGGQMAIVAVNQAQQEMGLPLSLVGFTKAFEGEGLDPAGAQNAQNELNQALQQRAEEARRRLIERQQGGEQ